MKIGRIAFVIGLILLAGYLGLNININERKTTTSKSLADSTYVTYSEEAFLKALKKGRPILYFWAAWCSTCKGLDLEMQQRAAELPPDVTILQIDYDKESGLKRNYNITQQHTLILLDENGLEKSRWIGGNFDAVIQQLNLN